MRNVPRLRFKEFIDEWEEKRLEKYITINGRIGFRGYTVNDIVECKENGAITLSPTNIIENKICFEKTTYISEYKYEESPEIKLKIGDIVLVKTGSTYGKVGLIKFLPWKATINPQLVIIRTNINNEFLYYFFNTSTFKNEIEKTVVGGAIPTLSQESLKKFTVYYTDLQEQEKIADFLSSVDKKISITEEKLNLFNKYKKGIMQKIFNQELRFKDENGNEYPEWEEKKLEEIANCLTGCPFDSEKFNELKLGLPLIRIRNLLNSNISTYYNGTYEEKYIIKKNDILIGMDGDFHTIKWNNKDSLLNQRIIKISSKNNLILYNSFLFYIIKKPIEKINLKISATTVKHLSTKDVFNIKIQLPCLEEQQKIADFLSAIDTKIEKISDELENLKEFKKGLLQQMFV